MRLSLQLAGCFVAALTSVSPVTINTVETVKKGQFLNFDEIDDLFAAPLMRGAMSSHIPLHTNSTWRANKAEFKAVRGISANFVEPSVFHVVERKDRGTNYEVLVGNLKDERGTNVGENIVVRRKSDGFVFNNVVVDGLGQRIFGHRTESEHSLISQETGHYHPTDDFEFDPELEEDRANIKTLRASLPRSRAYSGQLSDDDDGDAERDPDGNISIDLLCAMNPEGVEYAGDVESLCTAEVEGINLALANTGITDVKIRLVGAIVMEGAAGWNSMESETLHNAKELMKPLRDEYGADLLNMWLRVPGSSTRGRAYIDAYASIMEVHALSTLRHEVGHNAGLRHCPEDDKDNTHWVGWEQPETQRGTIMCGQDISMYSNDYMTDNGYSVGSKQVANAAEGWRTNAAKMSKYRPATLPYNWEHKVELLRDTVVWKNHKASKVGKFVVPEGAERATVMVASKLEQDKDYVTLYVKKDGEPSENDWDYRSVPDGNHGTRNNAYVHMKPVTPGTYYVAPESYYDPDEIVWDVVAWAFGENIEEGGNNNSNEDKTEAATHEAEKTKPITGKPVDPATKPSATEPPATEKPSDDGKAWSSSTTYDKPCTEVSYEGKTYLNGWYTQGTIPGSDGPWGVWRAKGSSTMHSQC
eukprot:Gregarina_sp_Pseudo_9__5747@NODE_842_length_2141_cov_804_323501_g790_i0_p1_GENE_NODE_842_length_2141_cov_804_323501_g790_i0NODE_842_length_2141_cov_804_323501_g790_i0_p1_ORF_typecomplete_len643_score114_00Reprolysin_3/PF13582_6/2_8e06Reprolysin_5/PF13688_6/0_0003Peptidase_M54/PF07998_11/0_00057Reprolysin_4/PF13583_6/0_00076Peptidase_M11/PF05548_11/0_0011PPC/PF04151_15/0_003Peptidase_M66/PF10462_9/1_2e04Peptidase_M66/PF10462_9/0_00082CBM_5_12_2/PF14600_6/0_0035CBM_5_12/PF02839_14/0_018Peptidase_M